MAQTEAQLISLRMPADWDSRWQKKLAKKIRRVGIIKTLWYPEIIDPLERGARSTLESLGIDSRCIETVTVAGALELPLAAQFMSDFDFLLLLGCVVNGKTPHFDFVCKSTFDGLMKVQLKTGVPQGNGILTVSNIKQAEERLSKGSEAAQAAYLQYFLKEKLKGK